MQKETQSAQRAEIAGRYLLKENKEAQQSLCKEYEISNHQLSDIRAQVNLNNAQFTEICLKAARGFYSREKDRISHIPSARDDAVSEAMSHDNFGQASIEASEQESEARGVEGQAGSSFLHHLAYC